MKQLLAARLIALLLITTASFSALAAEPESDFFTTSDGIRIHYLLLGDSGSWVLLNHGYTSSARGNWFRNGVAQALAENHRVVAIDARNHGLSDKPQPRGPGRASDTLELPDHLDIEKAHIHGYSMGGSITASLLASNPQRFITASLGGSGIRDTEDKWLEMIPPDYVGQDPDELVALRGLRISAAITNGATQREAEQTVDQQMAQEARRNPPNIGAVIESRPGTLKIDLGSIDIPVMTINGEHDGPNNKTFRLWRELNNFTNIRLPGKSHLTAISSTYMPKEYLENLVKFIAMHDE
ncbi:MAG: alpha/beta hydrolase [Gammaproteobacteria bacterium]|jgi:pimeloyl-ACP methyl ester carboxylesterase|nr:alpha/beta hydrolase [Gammaproteobacteria bacterium]MDP6654396.1 alpha/beta hydrolase [Gammaproteobacteria bacterium]